MKVPVCKVTKGDNMLTLLQRQFYPVPVVAKTSDDPTSRLAELYADEWYKGAVPALTNILEDKRSVSEIESTASFIERGVVKFTPSGIYIEDPGISIGYGSPIRFKRAFLDKYPVLESAEMSERPSKDIVVYSGKLVTVAVRKVGRIIYIVPSLNYSRKMVSFLPKLKENELETIIKSMTENLWYEGDIPPIYSVSYKMPEKNAYNGPVKLADGTLLWVPKKVVDKRAEFYSLSKEREKPPANFAILLDLQREKLYQTNSSGDIAPFSLKGAMPIEDSDRVNLMEGTLGDVVTNAYAANSLASLVTFSINSDELYDYAEQAADTPLHEVNKAGRLLNLINEIKGEYEGKYNSRSILPSTYLRLMGILTAIESSAGQYTQLRDRIARERQGFDAAKKEDIPTLPALRKDFKYLPHQAEAVSRLDKAGNTAIIDVSTGGGKTPILICDIVNLMSKGKIRRPLVVAPGTIIGTWIEAVDFFSGGQINAVAVTTETMANWGEKDIEKLVASAPPNTIFLTTYVYLRLGADVDAMQFPNIDWLKKHVKPDYVALDESHTIKNMDSGWSNAARALRDVPYRRLSTGTLLSNNPKDLIGQMSFINPRVFGTVEQFNEKYGFFTTKSGNVYAWKSDAAKRIREDLKTSSYYLIYREKDWAATLPKLNVDYHVVKMTPAQEKNYDRLVNETMEEIMKDPKLRKMWQELIESDDEEFSIGASLLAKFARLEQYVTAPDIDPLFKTSSAGSDKVSSKMKVIDDLIDKSIKAGKKCIVGLHYKFAAEHLLKHSRHKDVAVYYDASNKRVISQFSSDPGTKVVFAVMQSMKEGLNLQMADRVIIADIDWTPGATKQFIARIWRPEGAKFLKDKQVHVDYVVSDNSADVIKLGRLISKRLLNAEIMEDSPVEALSPPRISGAMSFMESAAQHENYFAADKRFNAWIEEQVETARKDPNYDLLPAKIKGTIPNSRKINVPWAVGMPLPRGVNGMFVSGFLQQQGLDDENLSDPKVKKALRNRVVKTEFGNGKIVGCRKRMVAVRLEDGSQQTINAAKVIVLDKAEVKDIEIPDEDIVAKKKKKGAAGKGGGKDNAVELDIGYLNGFLAVVADPSDPDSSQLSKAGFRWHGPYFYQFVRTRKFAEKLLTKLERKYTIPDGSMKQINEALKYLKQGRIVIKKKGPEIKNFMRLEHKKVPKGTLRLYPIIEENDLYLVFDKETHPGVNLSRYGFFQESGYWYLITDNPRKVVNAVEDVRKRAKLEIVDYSDFRKSCKQYGISLPKE
jgi:hypothetical protein